jgi:hypothetical protein
MGQWCGNLLLHAEGMPICESLMIARQYKLKIGVQQLHRRASKSLLPFLASARIIRLLRKPFRDITSQLLYILTKIIGASFQHQAYYSMQRGDSQQQTTSIRDVAVSRHRDHSAHTGSSGPTPCASMLRLSCSKDKKGPDTLTVRGKCAQRIGLWSDHGFAHEQSCNQQLISLPTTDMALPIPRSYVNLRYLASSHPLHVDLARF